jgi:hypothetical protein
MISAVLDEMAPKRRLRRQHPRVSRRVVSDRQTAQLNSDASITGHSDIAKKEVATPCCGSDDLRSERATKSVATFGLFDCAFLAEAECIMVTEKVGADKHLDDGKGR